MFQMARLIACLLLSLIVWGDALPMHLHRMVDAAQAEDVPMEEAEPEREMLSSHSELLSRDKVSGTLVLSASGRRAAGSIPRRAAPLLALAGHRLPGCGLVAPLRI